MKKFALPLFVGSTVLLVGTVALASDSTSVAQSGKGWADVDAPRRIRAYAAPLETHTGWRGLGDYLAATARTESRGDSRAVGDSGRSWGWFQIRPAAKCMQWLGLDGPELLNDEALQVAVAACHAYRLGTIYESPGQLVQWRDIRRGWKFPKWVQREYRDVAQTAANEKRFRRALQTVGVPESFATRRAFTPGMEILPVNYLVSLTRGVA